MARARASEKIVQLRKTFYARLHVPDQGRVVALTRLVLETAVGKVSQAVSQILNKLDDSLELEPDEEKKVIWADLSFVCQKYDLKRALDNATKQRRQAPTDKGAKEQARPQYKNSYHLEEVLERGDAHWLRFRIAEAFQWESIRKGKKVISRDLSLIDSKCLQQLIYSWLRPDLSHLPTGVRAGICQKAGEQLLSNIGLIDSGTQPSVSFPSLDSRDSEIKEEKRLAALRQAIQRVEPFEYRPARQVWPGSYDPKDKRGDRLVNVSSEWRELNRSTHGHTFPINFVQSSDVIVFKRRWVEVKRVKSTHRLGDLPGHQYKTTWEDRSESKERLYAALPLFKGAGPNSALAELAQNPTLFWWHQRLDEFEPLPAWAGEKLKAKSQVLLVPLECHSPWRYRPKPSPFEQALNGVDREVNWSLLVQNRRRIGNGPWFNEWYLHFATSREVGIEPRHQVLGVHFGVESILWWALADKSGKVITEDNISGNEILDQAISKKLKLEEDQKGLRWVGQKHFAKELQRRTYDVARRIVGLAAEHQASIALEKITWVDKRYGGPEANARFSLWNYARLPEAIKSVGLDRQEPIGVVAHILDYFPRYTCPGCSAIRKKGQPPEEATTWRKDNVLYCRACGFSGPVPDDHQARVVTVLGAKRL